MAASTYLTDAQRAQALARHALLRPHLDDGVPLTVLARDHHIPLRTVERWRSRYRQDGLAGLARQRRSDRGHRHLPDALIQLVEGLALRRPPPSIAAIHRQVRNVAEREAWPPPELQHRLRDCAGDRSGARRTGP